MTDFFKSAFGMFGNQNGNNAATSPQAGNSPQLKTNSPSNEFVGQIIMIGNIKLKVTKLLAEGMIWMSIHLIYNLFINFSNIKVGLLSFI